MSSSATATGLPPATHREIVNFGGNVRWTPLCYQPASEQEVLEILRAHAHQTVRAVGALHSWSEAAAGADVALDMNAGGVGSALMRSMAALKVPTTSVLAALLKPMAAGPRSNTRSAFQAI